MKHISRSGPYVKIFTTASVAYSTAKVLFAAVAPIIVPGSGYHSNLTGILPTAALAFAPKRRVCRLLHLFVCFCDGLSRDC